MQHNLGEVCSIKQQGIDFALLSLPEDFGVFETFQRSITIEQDRNRSIKESGCGVKPLSDLILSMHPVLSKVLLKYSKRSFILIILLHIKCPH